MRTTFSSDEIAELKKNPCVFDCTEKSVYYTHEFKQRALELQAGGVHTKEIWRRSGFDVSKWKDEYFRCTLRDWRKTVDKSGIEGLRRHGGTPHDRGPDKTSKDAIKRLELQVTYLEAENDFLAALRAKRAESNSGRTVQGFLHRYHLHSLPKQLCIPLGRERYRDRRGGCMEPL